MQKEQIIQEIQKLQEKLKGLWAQLPRSDWHAAFEALLRIEIFPYGDLVQIHAEEEIGIMPPRMDFVILTEKEDIRFEKEIFRFFRRINVLEYKNPDDDLNERVIRKAVGYANLYISEAKHKGERPSDQVTISIFRSEQNGKLFKKMEEEGTLKKDAVPGIYHVIGLTDLPFQIVITSELKGEEYAAYRALKKKADNGDLRRVLDAMRQEKNSKLLEYYWRAFRLMLEKNAEFMDVLKGGGRSECGRYADGSSEGKSKSEGRRRCERSGSPGRRSYRTRKEKDRGSYRTGKEKDRGSFERGESLERRSYGSKKTGGRERREIYADDGSDGSESAINHG